jgi:peptidoglycan/LPS O-acetylase OafA/YrhL
MLQGRELSDARFQLDSLDGLRGLAVLLVVLSHTSNEGIFFLPYLNFAGNGRSGVYLFFVLSAFLLTYPFISSRTGTFGHRYLLNFALRRFLRIYPLYSLCLLGSWLSTVTLWRIFGSDRPWGIPFTLTFNELTAHLTLQQGKSVTWSIVVEFFYYFLLPPLAIFYRTVLRNRPLPCVLATVILIWICQRIWPQADALADDIRLGPYLPIFLMGSLLAVLHFNWKTHGPHDGYRARLALELSGFCAIIVLALMIPSVAFLYVGSAITLDIYHRSLMEYGILWSIVLFSCINGAGYLRRFFELPLLRYLGFISFSVYLLHMSVIGIITTKLHTGTGFFDAWLILVVTVAASHVTWLLVEKPTSRLKLKH